MSHTKPDAQARWGQGPQLLALGPQAPESATGRPCWARCSHTPPPHPHPLGPCKRQGGQACTWHPAGSTARASSSSSPRGLSQPPPHSQALTNKCTIPWTEDSSPSIAGSSCSVAGYKQTRGCTIHLSVTLQLSSHRGNGWVNPILVHQNLML